MIFFVGFGALAALKRKRKKFSKSRNTSPVLEPSPSKSAPASSKKVNNTNWHSFELLVDWITGAFFLNCRCWNEHRVYRRALNVKKTQPMTSHTANRKVPSRRRMEASLHQRQTKVFAVQRHCWIHFCVSRIHYPIPIHVTRFHICRISHRFAVMSTTKDGFNNIIVFTLLCTHPHDCTYLNL